MDRLIKLYKLLFKDGKSNLPALFFFGLGIFGVITLLSGFITDFLKFPFILVATIASFVAMWYLHLLGSLTQQVEKLEETVTDLKANSDKLHTELLAFQTLRKNLELYAEDTKEDFSKVIDDMNKAFERLEELTKNNEKVLIARVAQDLEFLDGKEGMSSEEYRRFIARIPNNLKSKFDELGYNSFENVAGKDKVVDYKELKGIVETLA